MGAGLITERHKHAIAHCFADLAITTDLWKPRRLDHWHAMFSNPEKLLLCVVTALVVTGNLMSNGVHRQINMTSLTRDVGYRGALVVSSNMPTSLNACSACI